MRAKLANLNHCAVLKSPRRQLVLVRHESIIAVVTLKEVDRKYANQDWLYRGTLKTAFFANLTIKSAAKKINMVSVAIISQSYN